MGEMVLGSILFPQKRKRGGVLLKKLDRFVAKSFSVLSGMLLAGLVLSVFLQVVLRYVLKVSVAGLDEVPRYAMLYIVFLGAVLLTRSDDHVCIDVMDLFVHSNAWKRRISLLVHLFEIAALAVFGLFSFWYVLFFHHFGDVSAGLGLPLWLVTAVLPVYSVLSCCYLLMHTIKIWKGEEI